MALAYTPTELLGNILPLAFRATNLVFAQESGSPTFSSGQFAYPIYQRVASQPGFMALMAGICLRESTFNWTAVAGCPENAPPYGVSMPGGCSYPPGANIFTQNFLEAHSLGAPGVLMPPTVENQILAYSNCLPLYNASHAQGLGQCLGTYHLKNHPNSPFLAVPVGSQLQDLVYNPARTGALGINGIYNGPNQQAGAVNGFVAILCLMSSSLQQGAPLWSNWNESYVGTGQAVLAGSSIPQSQGVPSGIPVSGSSSAIEPKISGFGANGTPHPC